MSEDQGQFFLYLFFAKGEPQEEKFYNDLAAT